MGNSVLAKDIVKEYTAEYGMYVAQSRAIVSLMDGLKPVWRRCLNSANDLKLYHNKKHLKVSKLTGQVLGDYHPHGGANPVPLAQPFRFRYPLFEGQGNYGSPDLPDSAAAHRYLEIRLSEFAEKFYLESDSDKYADKEDNYDGRLKETTLYYPVLPGCLLTGSSGIAVGFSTEVPTHTISDIGNSLLKYIENPDSKDYLDGLYPETCEESEVVTPIEEVRNLYLRGSGSVRYKAKTHYETIDNKIALVVDAFPPDYSKKRLETPAILEAVDKGLLELSNESSEGIRYVFSSTDKSILQSIEERLTTSVGYRMYIEHRGVIKLYKLFEIYNTFIEEKSKYIIRKYSSMIEDINSNYEYLRVLLALKQDKKYRKDMFDKSSDVVVEEIMEKYKTSKIIANKIINTSLRSLMLDNLSSIKDNMERMENTASEYQSYINNPVEKIKLDIRNFLSNYKDDKKRAIYRDSSSAEVSITYRGKPWVINREKDYFLAKEDNTITRVYGSDLVNINLDEYSVAEGDKEYYFLHDGKGCCSVKREVLISSGSKLKSDKLSGIVGVNSLSEIRLKYPNGKVITNLEWTLRQRASYIRLVSEDSPDFIVLD